MSNKIKERNKYLNLLRSYIFWSKVSDSNRHAKSQTSCVTNYTTLSFFYFYVGVSCGTSITQDTWWEEKI